MNMALLSDTPPSATSNPPAVNEKTRQSPMPMVQRLKLMEAIRSAPADEPDSELATRLSLQVGRAIASATIKAYRQQLGLVSVASLTKAALRARLAELQAELQAAQQPSLPGL